MPINKDINYFGKCLRCGKKLSVNDSETGEIICQYCGCVLSEQAIDPNPEWRSSFEDVNQKRTGNKTTLARHDMGLSTIINPNNKDVTGKPLSPSMRSTIGRLRVWDTRTHLKANNRNFQQAFMELERIREKLGVSDMVSEKAAYIYRKAIEKELIRGRTISVLIASSLYAACRFTETPRTVTDIHNVTNIGRRDINKTYRLLVRELDLKMPVIDPINCVIRIANNVGVSEKTKRLAIEILQKAKQMNVSDGKDPTSLAASAVYLACIKMKEIFSQRRIATVANVTEVTIRNRKKGLQFLLK